MTDDTTSHDATGRDGTENDRRESGRTENDRTENERDGSLLAPDGGFAADDGTVEEMDLDELREEIRTIDREIVELIAQRTYVADTIARVKAERGLPTTDEEQEQQVMDRAGENAEQFGVDSNLVKAIFRLLIELNKVEQREQR